MRSEDLIRSLRQHSEESLEELRLHYGPLIHYIITPILQDTRDREECFSDILLRIWERIEQFDESRGSWTNWVSAIARNVAIDRVRRLPPVDGELSDALTAIRGNPEDALLQMERKKALREAVHSLDSAERILFYRKYYYRQSTAQIAAEMGTTERTVEGKLYRIRKKLRRLLGGDG